MRRVSWGKGRRGAHLIVEFFRVLHRGLVGEIKEGPEVFIRLGGGWGGLCLHGEEEGVGAEHEVDERRCHLRVLPRGQHARHLSQVPPRRGAGAAGSGAATAGCRPRRSTLALLFVSSRSARARLVPAALLVFFFVVFFFLK